MQVDIEIAITGGIHSMTAIGHSHGKKP